MLEKIPNGFVDHALKPIAYGVSVAIGAVPVAVATINDNISRFGAEQWGSLIVQSVGAFLFAVFLIYVLPQMMKFMRDMSQDMQKAIKDNNEANAKSLEKVAASFEKSDAAWRELVSTHGYCPVRDGSRTKKPEGSGREGGA